MKRIAILSVLSICLVALIGCETEADSLDEMPVPPVSKKDPALVPVRQNETLTWWTNRHNQIAANFSASKDWDILFIGDSITHNWEHEGLSTWNTTIKTAYKVENMGFWGDQTGNVIWRFQNGELPGGLRPSYAVIMIGTNNTGTGHGPASIAAGIAEICKMIHGVSPDTKIILLAIFPRGANSNDGSRINNEAVNALIAKYDGYMNIRYVNINQIFLNPDTTLKGAYYAGDALHLSAAGYAAEWNAIKDIFTE
jgi:lysophospholipase L1-like esterase